jgi:hypothetical protein
MATKIKAAREEENPVQDPKTHQIKAAREEKNLCA